LPYLDSHLEFFDQVFHPLPEIHAAGGRTVEKTSEIQGFGWHTKFSDMFGNVLGLFKPLMK
jgi:predicted enzyme related to lactoylglutathione lyase